MTDDYTDYEHVREFLKCRYPGDSSYRIIFTQMIALNDMFDFIHDEMPECFARMDRGCKAFRHLACVLISIQNENREYHEGKKQDRCDIADTN